MCDRAGILKAGEEEEIGIVVEGDILARLNSLAFDDSQLDDRGRVDGATVTVGCGRLVSMPS